MTSGGAVENSLDRAQIGQPKPLGRLQHAAQPLPIEDFRQVEQRAGYGGDRNASLQRPVLAIESANAVQPDASPSLAAAPRHGDVDDRGYRHQVPQRGGAAVTEQRRGPAGKYGRRPPTANGELAVAHRIDAPMDRVKARGGDPMVDRAASHARRQQLPPRDDAMLAVRQHGDHSVRRPLESTWVV